VLTDLGRVLRDEERAAWQRLLRVLGHEINNSLAPITSLTGTLSALVAMDPPPSDWREDARRGLGIIQARAGALGAVVRVALRAGAAAQAAGSYTGVILCCWESCASCSRVLAASACGKRCTWLEQNSEPWLMPVWLWPLAVLVM
jgi:hypothetical protein